MSRVSKNRPNPVPPHNFVFTTSRSFWSVVGIDPLNDFDIGVYDNRNLTGPLGSSTFGGDTIDFVAVDSNRRALGDYYPQVVPFSSAGGDYDISYVEGDVTVPDGVRTGSLGEGDVVNVQDTLFTAGVPTFFRIVPRNLDIEVFLMRSDSANAGTFVQGRSAAALVADVGGFEVREAFSFTETASQWDGLVVTNKSDSAGSYTVYRDTTAPSGSVAINNGAARTNRATVTLNLPATDADTGVFQMRISTDGTLDGEPWVTYAASRTVTLPGGDGTKTVAVQFRNNALMQSPVRTDTIVLDQRPNLVVTALSNPPASVRRGGSFSVTDTTRNSGPTATGRTTSTRYFLSTDRTRSTSDILLSGARTVPNLAVSTSNTGSRSVTVPASTGTVRYFLIGCADVGNLVPEFNEFDNCRSSTTQVLVNP